MTNITFTFQNKILTGIRAQGHSGYAEKGSDIICAAVSTLMQALLLGIMDVAKIPSVTARIDDEKILISVSWLAKYSSKIQILTHTIEKSLRQIASENSGYIKISEENI